MDFPSSQPEGDKGLVDSIKSKFQAHSAQPGPAVPKDFNVAEEGTKEERKAKAEELNKEAHIMK